MVELPLGSFLLSPDPARSCLAPYFSYEAAAAPGWVVGDASLPRLARVNLRVARGGDKPPPAAPDHAAFWGTEGMSVLSRAEEEEAGSPWGGSSHAGIWQAFCLMPAALRLCHSFHSVPQLKSTYPGSEEARLVVVQNQFIFYWI